MLKFHYKNAVLPQKIPNFITECSLLSTKQIIINIFYDFHIMISSNMYLIRIPSFLMVDPVLPWYGTVED